MDVVQRTSIRVSAALSCSVAHGQAVARIMQENGLRFIHVFRPSPRISLAAETGAGWPKFIKQVVMATPDKGAAVTLLVPSTSTLEDGSTVKVDTTYPFEDTVKITCTAKVHALSIYLPACVPVCLPACVSSFLPVGGSVGLNF